MRSFAPAVLTALVLGLPAGTAADAGSRPNVLIVSIDTLRADRLSGYGYERRTSPNIDRLMAAGVRFEQARTVEPLTGPAFCSMFTSAFPHENGAPRNGLRLRPGLPSLPKLLQPQGYRTAAIVSNWTLKNKASGLAEHFDDYRLVIKRKRWFGLFNGEAHADQVNEAALEWLDVHVRDHAGEPYLLWVHYVEPHAPYRLHRDYLPALGLDVDQKKFAAADRYDTEIARADAEIGELLEAFEKVKLLDNTIVVFTSDHGESLGEHDYWGHGRHLYEPTLHVPLSITWPGKLKPGTIDGPALNIDISPTLASLAGVEYPQEFRGYDWTGVFDGGEPPVDRVTHHQAHRGAVLARHDSDMIRRAGLLEVAVIRDNIKEILQVKSGLVWSYDLGQDPTELENLAGAPSDPTASLQEWRGIVNAGLNRSDETPAAPLDDETIEQLRALGYAD